MARRKRRTIRQAFTAARERVAAAPRVIIQRVQGGVKRRGGARSIAKGAVKSAADSPLVMSVVKSSTSWAAGALSGAAEGLTTTEGERKALPWARKGLSVALNYVAQRWNGKAGQLLSAAAGGIAGADGSKAVDKRAAAVTGKK